MSTARPPKAYLAVAVLISGRSVQRSEAAFHLNQSSVSQVWSCIGGKQDDSLTLSEFS